MLVPIAAACAGGTADGRPPSQSAGQPGQAREGALVELTGWAFDNGALAQTHDPDTGITWILFPRGSAVDLDDAPDDARAVTDVRITRARYAKETYDAAEEAVTRLAESGTAPYGFSIRLDAEDGVVSVETLAPAELTDPLSERFGEAIEFVPVDGGRFLPGTPGVRTTSDR